jgi:hypothetical protein
MGKPPFSLNPNNLKSAFLRKNGERQKILPYETSILMGDQPTVRASLRLDVNDAPHVGFVDSLAADTDTAEGRDLLAPFHSRYQTLSLQDPVLHRVPAVRAVHLKAIGLAEYIF